MQDALGSDLTGESRALLGDCLTGGWVKTVTPVDYQLPEPRLATRDSVRISAGDLDEAIQTVLLVADPGVDDDVNDVAGHFCEAAIADGEGPTDGVNDGVPQRWHDRVFSSR